MTQEIEAKIGEIVETTAKVPKAQPNPMISMMERLAKNPDVSIEKLQAVKEMADDIRKQKALEDFNQAMNNVQARMPRIKKNGKAEFVDKDGTKQSRSFARYEDIDKAIRDIYQKEGFACRFNSETGADGKPVIILKVSHLGGHTEILSMSLHLDTSGAKNNLQGMGSTISYARRYLTEMAFNIIREGADDDGAGADPVITIEEGVALDQRIRALPDGEAYRPKFMSYMKVENIPDIKAKDLVRAQNALLAKEQNKPQPKKEGQK